MSENPNDLIFEPSGDKGDKAAEQAPSGLPGMSSGSPLQSGSPLEAGSPLAQPSQTQTPPQAPPPGYTPGQAPPGAFGGNQPGGQQYVLAGWWSRVGATVIDTLVVGVAFGILFGIMIAIGGISSSAGSGVAAGFGIGAILLMVLFMLAIGLAYAPLLMAKTNGQTLGKMALGIRVVRADGQAMDFGFAALREVVVKGLLIGGVGGSALFGLGTLINYLWPLWDAENRCLHDMILNSRVVNA